MQIAKLETTTVERLIRLRTLLDRSTSAASDATAPGQHLAIVALDGVCEQALLLVAAELSINVRPKDSLLDLHSKVTEALGGRWSAVGSKAVIELHRSRNNVQHHGILPAPEYVPLWLIEVDRYIDGLVAAAFGVSLQEVHAAGAVADERLRRWLIDAEAAIAASETPEAVDLCVRALEFAVSLFESDRGGSEIRLGGITEFREFREIEAAIKRVDEFAAVAYFAIDPSDWLWLRALQSQVRAGRLVPSVAEATRAFAFSLSWILRWEAFRDRQPRHNVTWPEPDIDAVYPLPRVVEYLADDRAVRGNGRIGICAVLADVPPAWLRDVYDGMRKMRGDGNDEGLSAVAIDPPNRLSVAVDEHLDAAAAQQLLGELVAATHAHYTARLERRRGERDAAFSQAAEYRDRLRADPKGLVTAVLPADTSMFGSEGRVRVKLALPSDVLAGDFVDALRNIASEEGREAQGLWFVEEGTLDVPVASIPPESFDAWAGRAVERALERRRAEEQRVAEHKRRRESLVKGLNAL